MCGIAGFLGSGELDHLKTMARKISYRGPDEEGYFFAESPKIGLASRRLSIIDLESGHQPCFDEEKDIIVVFNGEIYNYRELRKGLEKRHRFETKSDTEVIAHLYEEEKEDFVKKLEGMFAIAIWDKKGGKLLLARDRFGEKPLYYSFFNGNFIFGSEPKSILAHPAARAELDRSTLEKYLLYEFVPAPQTIFKNILKLSAGHFLVLKNGKIRLEKYWDVTENNPLADLPSQDFQKVLEDKLDQAVKKMLVSDVPLGVFLSGGIDSATIAYFAQKNSKDKIETFSVGFDKDSFDETPYALAAAKQLESEHYHTVFGTKELLDLIPQIYSLLDEPMADPSLLPTFLLSKFTREKVKVALSGDGSDELFMGYQTFQAEQVASVYKLVPKILRNGVKNVVNLFPASSGYFSLDFKLKIFLNHFDNPPEIRNQLWIGAFSPFEIKELTGNHPDKIFENIAGGPPRLPEGDIPKRLSYLYLKNYLQDGILTKVDRASMFNSLEVRAPFLDHILASFVFALPTNEKLNGFTTKYILKRLMRNHIGKNIAYRKKHGFAPPVALWLNNDLAPLVSEYLDETRLTREGLFNAVYVKKLLAEHRSKKFDHRKKLWSLLVFQLWKENWLSV
ncbi:asparagine synthase (glutamine-hydrolyzing) [Candidatus Giovannonibacteria bacterium RIFCSPLOWO2_02_FULL_45_14]|uniref:asparagine synthase (glutamine-hydrolyzing) n=1 Tax=Candidatus Giovannonibacteria bacterium RIFCSPLOWO2_12_FULL_44_15 TaxID=1798364 RepID=A0A1F5Y0Z9_9BACT|nr:MAG: asparagine synthase (glutamine-hydrolyzing) [Candidatus Giovannonibacteria bacterium RIFCSPHIGHO2_02_FULL_44_31]OGF76667.1 MAG: asparagine synthase (glutamine-hydrolyzing) [Candidatus Giovannonibacteria bacterium RIFCSPHIGHO2_12_FULL_44_29]OGF91241.1 MAG: asparagine synthase (glutamine-hydrolyzing) [Candidatus Giovannonibacteria bacterium RIFCSPLOWO2_02_FULL_45_14]OGF93753.1 MAG: asparagine synthase (glutamine-hydrolyzing) [Candidatus Giovannonibacteria bacterium RIFCSPLOWO2_12_FULL_44_1